MYYAILLCSSLLFSSQFLCSRQFQRTAGPGRFSAFAASAYTGVITILTMLIKAGFQVRITPFSLLIAALYALNNIALTYFGLEALKYANLSVYSLFMMLGAVLLPSAYSFLFTDERFTVLKLLSLVFIFLSLLLTIEKGTRNKKAYLYYFLVFCGNGVAGVLSKIHQDSPYRVSTENFLMVSSAIKLVLCLGFLAMLCLQGKINRQALAPKAIAFSCGSGLVNSLGNYLNVLVLIYIPASVHSVITTGGVLVFSAVISGFLKEKVTVKTALSVAAAVAALIMAVL